MSNRVILYAAIIALILTMRFQAVAAESESAQSDKEVVVTRELFLERYNRWFEWKSSETYQKYSSLPSGTAGKYWRDLIDLGIDALPFIVEKMKDDPVLVSAFIQITALDPAPPSAYYDNNAKKPLGYEKNREFIMEWWKKDRRTLDADIRKDIAEIKRIKHDKSNKEKLDKALESMKKRYGVFLLPYIVQEIKDGDNDFVPITLHLISFVEKDSKKIQRLYDLSQSDEGMNVKAEEIIKSSEKCKTIFEKENKFIRNSHDEK